MNKEQAIIVIQLLTANSIDARHTQLVADLYKECEEIINGDSNTESDGDS